MRARSTPTPPLLGNHVDRSRRPSPERPGVRQEIAGYNVTAFTQETLGAGHGLLTGGVEIERGDTALYADEIEVFQDRDLAIAGGNVVPSQGTVRIGADLAEFNTKTELATFHRHRQHADASVRVPGRWPLRSTNRRTSQ